MADRAAATTHTPGGGLTAHQRHALATRARALTAILARGNGLAPPGAPSPRSFRGGVLPPALREQPPTDGSSGQGACPAPHHAPFNGALGVGTASGQVGGVSVLAQPALQLLVLYKGSDECQITVSTAHAEQRVQE